MSQGISQHTIDEISAFKEEYFNGAFYSSVFFHTHSLKDIMKDIHAGDFDIAVRLAVNAIQSMHQSAKTMQYKEALATEIQKQVQIHECNIGALQKRETAEKEAIKSHYTTALMEMETELRNLKATLAVNDTTIQKLREQLSQSDSMFRNALDDIVKQKETQYEKELERLSVSHQAMMDRMEFSARERVDSLRALYIENEEKLRKQLEKSLVSSEKGKQGEKEFDELVAQYTNWGSLENTAKTAHATDRCGKIKGCNVLFELKNYTGEVPSAEVEKFERDMEENHDVPFGVFISYKTGIRGKKADGFLTMKWTSRSQLLLFINHFYSHNVEDVLKFIETCAEIALTMYKGARDHPPDSELCLQLQGKIEQAKVFVEKEIQRMKEFLTSLDHDKKFLLATIQKQNTTYVYHIQQCAESLKTMLNVLLGVSMEQEGSGLASPPLPVLSEVSGGSNAAGGGGGSEDIVVVPVEAVKKSRGGKKKGGSN